MADSTIQMAQELGAATATADASTQAVQLFRQARLSGRLSRLAGLLTGSSPRLASLSTLEAQSRTCSRHELGLRVVPVSSIRGTEGKPGDFDSAFHPLQDRTRDRWLSVARAMLNDCPLPPVDLVQVGDTYFVRDGHHRVSVAAALGRRDIEAQVTAWDLVPSFPPCGAPRPALT
jgi:hypothetical protein